jgi:putative sigma-54 modulation protein
MNIEFVGRHVELDDRIRRHAEEKLGRVVKFLREPIDVHVIVEVEKNRRIAELRVSDRHGRFLSREENHDLAEAIEIAVDNVEKQARRARARTVDRRRRGRRAGPAGAAAWPVEVLARDSVGRGGRPRIVKSSTLEIKPMSLDDAALALEGSRSGFIVFRDSESDRVSVLYRRLDEDYGLIAPEL